MIVIRRRFILITEFEIKRNLGKRTFGLQMRVRIEGSEYILTGAVIRRNKNTGDFFYQAELQDLNSSRSILICRLEDIEKLEEKR